MFATGANKKYQIIITIMLWLVIYLIYVSMVTSVSASIFINSKTYVFVREHKTHAYNLYTMILVSFPSGGCIDEAVKNRQGYKYFYFFWYRILTVFSFMNVEGICSIIRRTTFNVRICLNHS